MLKRIVAVIFVALAAHACGGGGGDDATGFLDLQNFGNQSSFGGCGISFEVTRPNGSSRRTASVGPCGFFPMELSTGLWNVRARALGGACSGGGDFEQTVTVNKNQRTPLGVGCGACSACP